MSLLEAGMRPSSSHMQSMTPHTQPSSDSQVFSKQSFLSSGAVCHELEMEK